MEARSEGTVGSRRDEDAGVPEPVDRERLMQQMREANEKLVIAKIRADELAEEAREARATIARYVETLEAQERAKDEFLAMLAHELRNPLAPIVNTLHVLEITSAGVLEKERAVLRGQVKQLVRIVDDLLDISRVTHGKIVLETAPVQLARVVSRAVDTVTPLIEHKEHTVHVDVPEDGLVVDGDFVRLAQVVGNLVSNAAKYTPPRGHIDIAAERRGETIVLRVADNGIGLPSDMLRRVFDLCAQEHRGADRSAGGLGLGLTIAQRLVQMHGGTLTARSEGVGHGSTFEITLPASVHVVAPSPEVPHRAARVRVRVLVVDDNRAAAEALSILLTKLGYVVDVAYEANGALEIAAARPPDIALLDIGLPGTDGYELAAELRERGGGRELRFVAISGYGQEAFRRRSAELGFDAHLVKPVGFEELLETLARSSECVRAASVQR